MNFNHESSCKHESLLLANSHHIKEQINLIIFNRKLVCIRQPIFNFWFSILDWTNLSYGNNIKKRLKSNQTIDHCGSFALRLDFKLIEWFALDFVESTGNARFCGHAQMVSSDVEQTSSENHERQLKILILILFLYLLK